MTEDQRTAHVEMNGHVIKGTYHGGAYIDLSFGDGPAFEVINVWDYVTDKPTIAFTSDAVREQMVEWKEAAGESLDHDLREYRVSIGGPR